jgi:hypothetical protein
MGSAVARPRHRMRAPGGAVRGGSRRSRPCRIGSLHGSSRWNRCPVRRHCSNPYTRRASPPQRAEGRGAGAGSVHRLRSRAASRSSAACRAASRCASIRSRSARCWAMARSFGAPLATASLAAFACFPEGRSARYRSTPRQPPSSVGAAQPSEPERAQASSSASSSSRGCAASTIAFSSLVVVAPGTYRSRTFTSERAASQSVDRDGALHAGTSAFA